MPDVTFTIAARRYTVRCAEGQEAHLRSLALDLDERLMPLVDRAPSADHRQLLVVAALALLDELAAASAADPTDSVNEDAGAGAKTVAEGDSLHAMARSLQADCEALREENAALRLWAGRMANQLNRLSGSLGALAEDRAAD